VPLEYRSAKAAGTGPGKARKKPGRQTLVVLQDEAGFAGFCAIVSHKLLNTSILESGQLVGFSANGGLPAK
jgi:hypothetical protein